MDRHDDFYCRSDKKLHEMAAPSRNYRKIYKSCVIIGCFQKRTTLFLILNARLDLLILFYYASDNIKSVNFYVMIQILFL